MFKTLERLIGGASSRGLQGLGFVLLLATAGCAGGEVLTGLQVLSGTQLAGKFVDLSRKDGVTGSHVSVEAAGVDRTLTACREAITTFKLNETRVETTQRETILEASLLSPGSTNLVTATFKLRPRSQEKTVLLIEVHASGKSEIGARPLFKAVRKATEAPAAQSTTRPSNG